MKEEIRGDISDLTTILNQSWQSFYHILPSLAFAILLLLFGLFLIRSVGGFVSSFLNRRSTNQLVTDFLVNIVSLVLTIFLVVICLSILGWGSITNKILAGAGLTTFLVGFALKDIGENFLAGILMAFRRPFRLGDLIEVSNFKGRVFKMSLRETMIKTPDGRDVFLPNALILKTPLQNYTVDKFLRSDFQISLDPNQHEDIIQTMERIEQVVKNFDEVQKTPEPQVVIDSFSDDKVQIRVSFWYTTDDVRAPGIKLRSNVMARVFARLRENHISFNAQEL